MRWSAADIRRGRFRACGPVVLGARRQHPKGPWHSLPGQARPGAELHRQGGQMEKVLTDKVEVIALFTDRCTDTDALTRIILRADQLLW